MKVAICVNGEIRETEIEEFDESQSEMPEPEPTPEERLESVEKRTSDLETNSAEIQEALDLLLSGVTE